MKAIDTKSWAEFKVGDLFDMVPGKRVRKHDQEPGDILFVMASSANQGIVSLITNPITTVKNGITVDILGNCYYHPERVGYGDDNASLKLKKQYIKYETENVYLFLSTILHNIAKHASFTNKLRGTWYIEQTIKLPVKDASAASVQEGPLDFAYAKSWRTPAEPDWDYMEAFMEQINQQAQARLDEYKEGKLEYTTLDSKIGYTPVDTKSWAEFKVGDLFDINSSKKIYHAINVTIIPTQEDGYYSYVVRQKSNNGIRGYIQEDLESLNPANTISFAQDTAEMFWQSQPYFTGNKVKVMSVKNQELTELISLFLISGLKRAFSNFRYISSYTVDNIKNVALKLPIQQIIDPDKTYHPEGYIPDWDYMEAFMKQINQQAQAKLDTLEKGKA